jgi:hypothetical protein
MAPMTAPLEMTASHSHLYPGARGSAEGRLRDGPVAMTFADGIRVPGRLDGDRLTLDAHRTAKGTAIGRKTWVVAEGPTDSVGRISFRIAARA